MSSRLEKSMYNTKFYLEEIRVIDDTISRNCGEFKQWIIAQADQSLKYLYVSTAQVDNCIWL